MSCGGLEAADQVKLAKGPRRRDRAKRAKGEIAVTKTLTSDLVEAYSLCPRKAFLLATGAATNPGAHAYEYVIRGRADANRQSYGSRLEQAHEVALLGGPADLAAGSEVIADAELATSGLHARYDFLVKVDHPSEVGRHGYKPVRVIGTNGVSRADAVGCAYQALVLGEVQGWLPASATLIQLDGHPRKVRLVEKYKGVRRIVDTLRGWADQPAGDAPPVVLNKHCPICPFREACLQQAEKEDSLSLLDRMTPKLMRKYHEKGISTVRQLSHIFRPRRSRSRGKRPARHSLELQALAIRTGKTYIEHLPDLARWPVEFFVDVEGVRDRNSFYLIGLLIYTDGDVKYHTFWADGPDDEARLWQAFISRVASVPDAPIYHYGSYERKAFKTLVRRHGGGQELEGRLINVASSVFGRVYFPVRSNGLKVLGRFLGATWTDPEASGLQSLVWRSRWEATRDDRHKTALMQYNREDCEALRILVGRLRQIQETAAAEPTVEFANRPKQTATGPGRAMHQQFERILRYAQEDGQRRSVRIRAGDAADETEPRKKGAPRGHQAFRRIVPSKVGKTVRLASSGGAHGSTATSYMMAKVWRRARSSTSSLPGTAAERRSRGSPGKRDGVRSANRLPATRPRPVLPTPVRPRFPGLDRLSTDHPSSAIPHHCPGDRAFIRDWSQHWHHRAVPPVPGRILRGHGGRRPRRHPQERLRPRR